MSTDPRIQLPFGPPLTNHNLPKPQPANDLKRANQELTALRQERDKLQEDMDTLRSASAKCLRYMRQYTEEASALDSTSDSAASSLEKLMEWVQQWNKAFKTASLSIGQEAAMSSSDKQ